MKFVFAALIAAIALSAGENAVAQVVPPGHKGPGVVYAVSKFTAPNPARQIQVFFASPTAIGKKVDLLESLYVHGELVSTSKGDVFQLDEICGYTPEIAHGHIAKAPWVKSAQFVKNPK